MTLFSFYGFYQFIGNVTLFVSISMGKLWWFPIKKYWKCTSQDAFSSQSSLPGWYKKNTDTNLYSALKLVGCWIRFTWLLHEKIDAAGLACIFSVLWMNINSCCAICHKVMLWKAAGSTCASDSFFFPSRKHRHVCSFTVCGCEVLWKYGRVFGPLLWSDTYCWHSLYLL